MALKIKKGDKVLVISGKDKGKKGKVLKVISDKQRVIIEGVNVSKKHTKPTQDNPQGGIIQKELPIHTSNVMLICPSCGKSTRIGKTAGQGKEKRRICNRCGTEMGGK